MSIFSSIAPTSTCLVWAIVATFSIIAILFLLKIASKAANLPAPNHMSELSRLVENAHQRDKEMKALLDISTNGYWIWNIQTGHDFLSHSWCNLLGYRQSELDQHVDTWTMLMHPEDRTKANLALKKHIQSIGKTPYKLEARYRHKDGHWVTLVDQGKVIEWASDGSALRMVGFERKVL